MAYKPTIGDIDRLEKASAKTYTPTIADIDRLEKKPTGSGIGQKIAAIPEGVANSVINMALSPGNFADKALSGVLGTKPNPVTVDYGKGNPNEFLKKTGEIAGGFLMPELGLAKGAQALSGLPSVIKSILGGAAEGGAYGALSSAEGQKSSATPALEGALIGGSAPGIAKVPSALAALAANKYRKELTKKADTMPYLFNSPEKVGEISQKLDGIPANIAELANHSAGQSLFTDWLGHMPFSGVRPKEEALLNNAIGTQKRFIDSLKGGADTADMPSILTNYLEKESLARRDKTRENFRAVFDAADRAGVSLGEPKNFNRTADKIISEHSSGEKKAIPKSSLDYIKNLRSMFEPKRGAGDVVGGGETGILPEGFSYPRGKAEYTSMPDISLLKAHVKRSDLGDYAREAKDKPTLQSNYTALRNAIDQDIKQAVESSGNKQIGDLYKAALKYHAQEYLPYKATEIQNLIGNKKNELGVFADLLNSKNKKILQDMPQELKNMIAFNKIRTGEGVAGDKLPSPGVTNNIIQGIHPSVAKRLFSPGQLDEISRLNALTEASKKAAASINKPATGYKLMGQKVLSMLGAGTLGGIPIARSVSNIMAGKELRDAYINRRNVDSSAIAKEMLPAVSAAYGAYAPAIIRALTIQLGDKQ